MAICAHPDDEGAVLATLAKYARLGHRVIIAWDTKGERWVTPFGKYTSFLHWLVFKKKNQRIKNKLYEIISRIRTREVEKVLTLLNVKGEFLDFIDGSIPNPSNSRALIKIIDLIRQYKPSSFINSSF